DARVTLAGFARAFQTRPREWSTLPARPDSHPNLTCNAFRPGSSTGSRGEIPSCGAARRDGPECPADPSYGLVNAAPAPVVPFRSAWERRASHPQLRSLPKEVPRLLPIGACRRWPRIAVVGAAMCGAALRAAAAALPGPGSAEPASLTVADCVRLARERAPSVT